MYNKLDNLILIDLDYELSDNDVYNAVAKAKGFIDKLTTALEIMNLVKFILEHEIDVNENVSYIVSGICRRTVFEYTKRRMSCKLTTEINYLKIFV